MDKTARIDFLLEYGLRAQVALVLGAFVVMIFRNWWADTSGHTLLCRAGFTVP
jgi:hypothetical protein